MTANPSVSYSVAVADPNFPQNFIKPNADGSVNVVGGGGGGGVGSVVVAGQYKVTASAAAISSSVALTNGVVIKAKLTNVGTVFLGGSGVTTTYDGTGNGYALGPGEAASFPVNNLNLIYAIGTANDVILWEGN